MAIDTREKRFSMLNFGDGCHIHATFEADGAVDLDDRQHLLDCYSGIAFAVPVAQPLLPDDLFTARRIIKRDINPKSDIKIIKISSGNK